MPAGGNDDPGGQKVSRYLQWWHGTVWRNERAQTMAEYAVVMSVIVLGCMSAYFAFQAGVAAGTLSQVTVILSGL